MREQLSSREIYSKAERIFTICNACRYCEGFCAVFQAMELRREFKKEDINYFAYLCHDCRDCYSACPFIPPHEFSIDIPKTLSEVRSIIHEENSFNPFRKIVKLRSKFDILLVLLSILTTFLVSLALMTPKQFIYLRVGPGSFYDIIPFWVVEPIGLFLAIYVASSWVYSAIKYWRSIGGKGIKISALINALREGFKHEWFRGGGVGCSYPKEDQGFSRLYFHFLVVLGFILDTISTLSASIMQNFMGVSPPFSIYSLPVVSGTVGGLMLAFGSLALIYLKLKSDKRQVSRKMLEMDYFFLFLLFAISVTGLMTLALRETPYLSIILDTHLGFTVPLFFTAPYEKFSHFVYRTIALMKKQMELS